jgi:hypothetical protein
LCSRVWFLRLAGSPSATRISPNTTVLLPSIGRVLCGYVTNFSAGSWASFYRFFGVGAPPDNGLMSRPLLATCSWFWLTRATSPTLPIPYFATPRFELFDLALPRLEFAAMPRTIRALPVCRHATNDPSLKYCRTTLEFFISGLSVKIIPSRLHCATDKV